MKQSLGKVQVSVIIVNTMHIHIILANLKLIYLALELQRMNPHVIDCYVKLSQIFIELAYDLHSKICMI